MQFEVVLHDDCYRQLDLSHFYCVVLAEKQRTSHLVKKLSNIWPLNKFTHLKRVKSIDKEIRVLIKEVAKADGGIEAVTQQLLQLELVVQGVDHVVIAMVPAQRPVTRKQFLEAQKYWPCHFYEDKRMEQVLSSQIFSRDEIEAYKRYMQAAKDEGSNELAGAVMVDPGSGDIVARACTNVDHPLQHAVMRCIDRVAMLQGGGVWKGNPHVPSLLQGSPGANCSDVGDSVAQKSSTAAVDGECSKCDVVPAKKRKVESYLCTGYDLFTTHEPCTMCAMALVHSRIGRVFYDLRDPFSGSLGSREKIHCHSCLNHKFEVFRTKSCA